MRPLDKYIYAYYVSHWYVGQQVGRDHQPSLQMNVNVGHVISKPSSTFPSSAKSTIPNLLDDSSSRKIGHAEWPLMIPTTRVDQFDCSSIFTTKPSLPGATAPHDDNLELTLGAPVALNHQRSKTCSQGLLVGPIISVT